MPSWPGVFQFCTFFSGALSEPVYMFSSRLSSYLCISFFNVINPFGLSIIYFPFSYLALKLLCFLRFRLFICPWPFYPDTLVDFLSLFFEDLVLLVCIVCFSPDIFLVSLLLPICFGLFLQLYCLAFLLLFFFLDLFIPLCFCVFSFH